MDLAISDSLCYYMGEVIIKKDSIISLTDKKFLEADKYSTNLESQIVSIKKKNKKSATIIGISGTLLGLVLGVFLIK